MPHSAAELSLDHLFRARSVAVFGASTRRRGANGNQVIRNIRASGFDGQIFVVNPSGGTIEGIEARTDASQLPKIDVAVLTLPPGAVPDVVLALEAVGCPVVVVLSVGFDAAQLAQLKAVQARGRTAIHGPNCMGILDVAGGLALWNDEGVLTDLPKGGISLVSQSGSGAIFVARSIGAGGFARVISTGNEAGLTTADYLNWLAGDAQTKVIGLIIEAIADVDAFAAAARRAKAAGKCVVALKVGRSQRGAVATTAHTGALISDDAVAAALFARLGVPLVGDYDELASALELLAVLDGAQVQPGGVAVVTISGGQAALIADLADRLGVQLADLHPQTCAKLAEIWEDATINNPFDVASGATGEESLGTAITILAQDPGVQAIVAILDAQSSLNDTEVSFEDNYFAAVFQAKVSIPVVIASSSSMTIHHTRRTSHPVPVLRGLGNTLVALRAAMTRATGVEAPERPANIPDPVQLATLRHRLPVKGGVLDAALTRDILQAYGLSFVASTIATDLKAAIIWADTHGYPLVLKVASPDIAHRSDIGAVILNIADAAALTTAWDTIHRNVTHHRPDARIEGIEMQRQISRQIEAFVGHIHDPHLGAAVALGMGGVLVELVGDAARAMAPLSAQEAATMIANTRLGRILDGYRGLNPVTPTDGLADLAMRLSWMARDLGDVIAESDLNPVLIEPATGKTTLIDALLVARATAPSPGA